LNNNCIVDIPATSRRVNLKGSWDSILNSYSNASLAFPSDKLVALSGIVKYLSKKGLGAYVAGLWRDNLELQLLWDTYGGKYGTRPSPYRAPSWSWAALDESSVFSYESIEERISRVGNAL
jgi:hypothetical protein